MSTTPSDQSSRPYTHIGKYEVLAHIATGGMGVVYRARDTERNREVALKVLPSELAVQPDKLERFRREARHGARLRHKNIARIFEFGEVNGTYFLVLEFVQGVDLHQYIQKKGRLDPAESCRIIRQAARALDHMHRLGVVHRDVKPSNFLLTRRDGRLLVKLTDLGLAREADDSEFRVTREGNTVGTVDYMAPEQARNSGAADIRSDIYALGCTLFHMLAGKPPFSEGGMIERLYRHIEEEAPDIRQLNPQVPEALAVMLQRMLTKKPADRYQTPAELLQDLVCLKQGRPLKAAEPARSAEREAKSAEVAPPPQEKEPAPVPPAARAPTVLRSSDPGTSTQEILAAGYEASLVAAPSAEQQRAAAGQFERAQEVILSGNHDYGIHLLLSCCKLDPANLSYRRALRQAEKTKFQHNQRGSRFAWLSTLAARTRLKNARRTGNYLKVLAHGEEVLTQNPWDLGTQMDMAEAADALGLLNLAVWLLEEARERDAGRADLNRALARLYEKRRNFSQAIALWELVREADPRDVEASQKITDLAASETIARVSSRGSTKGRSGPQATRPK